MYKALVNGGTIVGIRAKDGVVLASEKRLSYNGFVLSKRVRKVHPITNHIGIGFAGLHGDIERLVKLLKAQAQYYEIEIGKEISVRSLAKYYSNLLFSYKIIPFYVESIVGGVDGKGPQIYVLDPVGSLIEDKYSVAGSGGPIAIGIIETSYREDMSVEEAKELAKKAILEAIERDAISGDGVDILIITRDGYRLEEILFKR